MKVCNVDRITVYKALAFAYKALKVQPSVAELGVLKGDNAHNIRVALAPRRLLLIDAWSADALRAGFHPFAERPAWVADPSILDPYYGGSVAEQTTFDRLYEQCRARFQDRSEVQLLRADTVDALQQLGDERFDLVYVDANHRYEHVLRELLLWKDRVAQDGLLMLNDCCYSPLAASMNFGVLPALTEFVKRTDFVPALMTNGDFSDVVLARRGSAIEQRLNEIVAASDVPYVDVPHQLLGACRVVPGKGRSNISFL